MTAKLNVTIWCDGMQFGFDCSNWVAYSHRRKSDARREISSLGYRFVRRKRRGFDLCPDCYKKLEQEQPK